MNRIAFLSGVGFLLVFGYAGNHTIHAETVEPQTQETTEDIDPLEPMEPTVEQEQIQQQMPLQNEQTEEDMQPVARVEEEPATVQYQTHVQTYGWQTPKVDGQTAGTSGQSKRLESIRISVKDSQLSGHIQYRTHIQTYGWETSWKQDGQISGTSGQSKRLEAIQIRLTDQLADLYSIYYRVHCQNYGWLGWAKDGEYAGSQGFSKRLEAIEIQLVKKGEKAPVQDKTAFVCPYIRYTTHVQRLGWQAEKADGQLAGTNGQSLRLEAIKILLNNYPGISGSIAYRSHIQGIGWEAAWRKNGQVSGTNGQSKRLEAIQIRLEGAVTKEYDVYYRVHTQNFGWLEWTSNGCSSGTQGDNLRLEGIEIRLVKKNTKAPSTVNTVSFLHKDTPYYNDKKLTGWQRINGNYYYADSKNHLVKGFYILNGKEYGFDFKTGKQLINQFVYLDHAGYGSRNHKVVYFDKDGILVKYSMQRNRATISIDSQGIVQSVTHNGIRYYSQLDGKWANKTIGGYTIGATGCLPTVSTMVINYLFGLEETPVTIGQNLYANQYYNNPKYGKGTIASAWEHLSRQYGFHIQYIYDSSGLKAALARGDLVVGAVESTLFGQYGYTHELLLYNYVSSNHCQAYDPYFKSNNKSFSIDKFWTYRTQTKEDRLHNACFFSITR